MSTADTQEIYRNIPNRCTRCILQGWSCYQKTCKEKDWCLSLELITLSCCYSYCTDQIYFSSFWFSSFVFIIFRIYMYFPLVLLVCLLGFQSVTVGHINTMIRVFFLHGHFNRTSIHIINYRQWEVSTSSIF